MPVNIKLDEKTKITSDKYGYTVSQFSHIAGPDAKNSGEEVWVPLGHYGNIESMLKTLPDRMVMQDDIETLSGLLDRLKYWQDYISRAINGDRGATKTENQ